MLANLKIENIAIIENALIDFSNGFNCMTGETGAGKSIVIDSINAVLGEKTSRELIRTGELKAKITAFFTDISEKTKRTLSDMGLPCEDDSTLLISRVLTRDGKNICKINGETVTVSMLKSVGRGLINIHGQSDNQELMSPDLHYTFIDAVADNANLLEKYKQSYDNLLALRSKIKSLNIDDALKARQIDLLTYQIDELEKANIRIGERNELTERRKVITNAQKLIDCLQTAHNAIAGNDEYPGASQMLFDASRALSSASEFLSDISDMAESVSDAAYSIDSYTSDLDSIIENLIFDEHELYDIEERIDLIYRLSKKYGETEEEMLLFLDKAKKELHNITYSDELLNDLKNKEEQCKNETYALAKKLSASRMEAAKVFSEMIREELAFLDMPNTLFSVSQKEIDFSETGIDNIEFLISANKGEDPKPLAKIASGGELSRIMLAIKSVLADKDNTDTLIFDEIDSGVSGRAAGKIAIKLTDVSRHRQVICITHLPSIAAYADRHMLISKFVKCDKTYTSVIPLDEKGRTAEISRIIGGNEGDKIHLQSAELLLKEANLYKEKQKT